jgi:hypothetical protein
MTFQSRRLVTPNPNCSVSQNCFLSNKSCQKSHLLLDAKSCFQSTYKVLFSPVKQGVCVLIVCLFIPIKTNFYLYSITMCFVIVFVMCFNCLFIPIKTNFYHYSITMCFVIVFVMCFNCLFIPIKTNFYHFSITNGLSVATAATNGGCSTDFLAVKCLFSVFSFHNSICFIQTVIFNFHFYNSICYTLFKFRGRSKTF